jgi:hypothetical protein
VPICLLQHLAECHKRLHIASGAHHLYNDIERWRRLLARRTTEELWDIWWRRFGVLL